MPAQTRPWPVPPLLLEGGLTVHHISDTHIGYRAWSHAESAHMLRDLNDGLIPPVDVCVHTGDIVDGPDLPTEDPYARSWLTSAAKGAPSVWAVGNHDLRDRTPTTRAAWEAVYGRPGNTYVDVAGYRVVTFTVDSHTINADWVVPEATWSWLDQVTAAAPGPVVLAEHFPPWELGVAEMNALQPPERFAELVSDHPQIVGMLAGHMHWEPSDERSAVMLQVGNRTNFPVLTDVSSMLSISGLSRDQSAQLPSVSAYVTILPDLWEVRYRHHGPHAWSGPGGMRVTRLHLDTGEETRTM
jgi:3',5'-cyclic-AMP phosphodiesterase